MRCRLAKQGARQQHQCNHHAVDIEKMQRPPVRLWIRSGWRCAVNVQAALSFGECRHGVKRQDRADADAPRSNRIVHARPNFRRAADARRMPRSEPYPRARRPLCVARCDDDAAPYVPGNKPVWRPPKAKGISCRLRLRKRPGKSAAIPRRRRVRVARATGKRPVLDEVRTWKGRKTRRRLQELVGVRGFEPPTPASRTQYSTRLSYTPNEGNRQHPATILSAAHRKKHAASRVCNF